MHAFPNPLLLLWYILHIINCYHHNTNKVMMSHLFLKTLSVFEWRWRSSLFPVVSFFPSPLLLLWYILHIIKCYHYNTAKVWLFLSSGNLSYCSDLWKKMQATLHYTSVAFSGGWENVSFLWFQQRSMEHSLWFDRLRFTPPPHRFI